MIKIRIGNEEHSADPIDEQWITQQITNRRKEGESVCVVITIDKPDIHVTLASAECPSGRGGSRKFSSREMEVIEEWRQLGLRETNAAPGQFVSFLKKIRKI